jgi:transposase
MPKAYSIDFREKILDAYLSQEGSTQEIAKRFKISISTVKRIGQRYRNTGKIELYINRVGSKPKITQQARDFIKQTICIKPDASLEEIKDIIGKSCKIYVTIQAIHYFLKSLDPSSLVFLDESGANLAMTRTYGGIAQDQRLILP